MAGGSFFALLDDITALMDDVAVMTKVTTQKTAGILGDDLAVNAQQLTGISPKRELPIVWAVTKGSLINKLILVPLALLLSAFFPQAIIYLLMAGGVYLCYEGAEKLITWLFLGGQHQAKSEDPKKLDPIVFEKNKVKGAVITDFVLSAEIVIIALGTLQGMNKPFIDIVIALSLIAILLTFAVYGIVALIVKLDDLGIYLVAKKTQLLRYLGKMILWFAPNFMKLLTIVGTFAMFVVGGHIWVSHIPSLSQFIVSILHPLTGHTHDFAEYGLEILLGLFIGWLAILCIQSISKVVTRFRKQ